MFAAAAGVEESVEQLASAFSIFAQASPRGEVLRYPGLHICSANVSMAALNLAVLAAPGEGVELSHRVLTARDYFRSGARSGTLIAPEAWVAEADRAALETLGIRQILQLIGMVAPVVGEPTRPAADVEVRRAVDRATIDAVAEVNAEAYRDPAEWGREAVALDAVWRERIFAHVGYVGGCPVAAAATVPLDGVLYVAWVATLPEHRRRGYAETVMRASVAEAARATGLTRTALHASTAGFAMYLQMGYRPVCRFLAYRLDA